MSNIERKTWGNISKIINLLLVIKDKYDVYFEYNSHVRRFDFGVEKLYKNHFYTDSENVEISEVALKELRDFYTKTIMNEVFVIIDGKEVVCENL
jgi:hypothetical protein